jgi:hypothetical protein
MQDNWKPTGPNYFSQLPDDVVATILELLDHISLLKARNACTQFRRIARKYFLVERKELICFHSKLYYWEDILGIAINIDDKSATSQGISRHSLIFEKLIIRNNKGDIISWKSFHKDKIRKGLWGNKFNAFLPLMIHPGT